MQLKRRIRNLAYRLGCWLISFEYVPGPRRGSGARTQHTLRRLIAGQREEIRVLRLAACVASSRSSLLEQEARRRRTIREMPKWT